MRNIFITGATGFLGSEIVRQISDSDEKSFIYALARGSKNVEGRNVKMCDGDITKKNLGLNKDLLEKLTAEIDEIYHCAAITDLNRPITELRRVNVEGTRNVLDFALVCKGKGRLKKVHHISTSYVAGKTGLKACRIMEKDLYIDKPFNNNYEQSKSEAEQCVGGYRNKGLDINIFRPSIILGRFHDGKTTNFKMLYQPIHSFSLELFDKIPEPVYNVGNIINLDIAARAICLISKKLDSKNMNYHITSPKTVSLKYVLDIASDFFGFKMPEFMPASDFDMNKEYTAVKRKLLEPYLSYFNYGGQFDMTNTIAQLSGTGFEFPSFDRSNFTRLFEYCAKSGFIKRKSHAAIR